MGSGNRPPPQLNHVVTGLLTLVFASCAAGSYVGVDLYTVGMPSGVISTSFSGYAYAAGGQVVGEGSGSNYAHALLWSQSAPSGIDLNPAGFNSSYAFGTDGLRQVGHAWNGLSGPYFHAILWSGNSSSAVDLHPFGYIMSDAIGIGGNQQVGSARIESSSFDHAMLWSGSAASAVDLNPATVYVSSAAFATDGEHQVGEVRLTIAPHRSRAALWSGSAESLVDLNLGGFSTAYGVCGNEQVGAASTTLNPDPLHAVLWHGSTFSAVHLYPDESAAIATNGTNQVGWFKSGIDLHHHAALWSGSASSLVDLNGLLPAGFTQSEALSIDAAGTVFGIARDSSNAVHAVAWYVPEPTGMLAVSIFSMTGVAGMRRRALRN